MTENRASRASQRYDAENTKRVYIKLNKGTDADIIDVLEAQSNVQGYFKALIRKDMKDMKEYVVTLLSTNKNDDSETVQLTTRNLDKAIKEAEYFRNRNTPVEIRVYADPDREETGNWDYDLVEF